MTTTIAPDQTLAAEQIASLHPKNELTRRAFIVTSLATGFAAAVQPVSATTITTDSQGLIAGEIKIPTPDGDIPAYRAMPDVKTEVKTRLPVIVVIHEIFGVHEHIKDLCRRLAKSGYLAIAPDLYARHGDVSKYPSIPDLITNVVSKTTDAEIATDLDTTVAWALAHGGSADKVGITGFCWGGRQVWLYAAHSNKIKAAVAWYGGLSGKATENTPRYPVDVAAELKAPVLGLYAGKDQGITAEHIATMRVALKGVPKVASDSTLIVFPEAQHGFNADYRPSYSEADAQEGWAKMLAFFRAHGVA